jgi:hypothetical protein
MFLIKNQNQMTNLPPVGNLSEGACLQGWLDPGQK